MYKIIKIIYYFLLKKSIQIKTLKMEATEKILMEKLASSLIKQPNSIRAIEELFALGDEIERMDMENKNELHKIVVKRIEVLTAIHNDLHTALIRKLDQYVNKFNINDTVLCEK